MIQQKWHLMNLARGGAMMVAMCLKAGMFNVGMYVVMADASWSSDSGDSNRQWPDRYTDPNWRDGSR